MATFDIPDDLLQLRRDFLAADAAWAAAPDRDAARRAYEEAGRLAEAIQDHEWWADCGGNPFNARMALIAAANQAPA